MITRANAVRGLVVLLALAPLRGAVDSTLPSAPIEVRRRPKSGRRPWRQRKGNGWYYQFFHDGGRK